MEKLMMKVTQGTERELILTANSMNDLVEKIIEWQSWDSQPHKYFERKGVLQEEKESGWYYFG